MRQLIFSQQSNVNSLILFYLSRPGDQFQIAKNYLPQNLVKEQKA
jgi:hypothetical protein